MRFVFGISLLSVLVGTQSASARELTEKSIRELRLMVVEFINQDREKASAQPVVYSEPLSLLADEHCREMLREGYTSHWNRAGWKPYMRYSQGGFTDHTSENIASMNSTGFEVSFDSVKAELTARHESLVGEEPPYDQHRRNILDPHHTHVGIGVAYSRTGLRMIQIFARRYVSLEPIPARQGPSSSVQLKGKLLEPGYDLQAISVFYEPLPEEMSLAQLMGTYSYALPADEKIYRTRLPSIMRYADGTRGSVDVRGRSFSQTISIPSRKGVYTLVVWLEKESEIRGFTATNATVFVE